MCDTLYSLRSDGVLACRSRNWSISRGVTLMRCDDVALAQQLQGDLLADLLAVGGVVDALLGERVGQLR